MMEFISVAFEGGTFTAIILVGALVFELKKEVASHDERQRAIQASVDNIAGRMHIMERAAFPAVVSTNKGKQL